MGKTSQRIRVARLDDIEAMQSIESAAGGLFAEIGMHDVAAHPPLEHEVLATYVDSGRAWIAEDDDQPQGYALADVVDGHGHLEQVSVHPAYGRQGLGRALIKTVIEWAKAQGCSSLTLLTFRDVPWNGPYYAALGFEALPDEELPLGYVPFETTRVTWDSIETLASLCPWALREGAVLQLYANGVPDSAIGKENLPDPRRRLEPSPQSYMDGPLLHDHRDHDEPERLGHTVVLQSRQRGGMLGMR